MKQVISSLLSVACLITSLTAAPAAVEGRQSSCSGPDCLPGYTATHYHVVFDFIKSPDGTPITSLQGLNYTGFAVSGRQNGFNPYPQPQPHRTPKFAVADHARDQDPNALPSLTVEDLGQGQNLFKLKSFYWAAYPYLAENITLSVQCWNPNPKKKSELKFSGKKVAFVYNTGYNVGANGAQVQEATMPPTFTCNQYKFNITKISGSDPSGPVPTLFLDELREVTYYPVSSG